MAVSTIGRATHATRRATAPTTSLKYLGAALLAIGWAGVIANAFGVLGQPMAMPEIATVLSVLIVVSLLAGIFQIVRGPCFYKALRLGEAIGEQKERRHHRCPVAPSQRVGAITG